MARKRPSIGLKYPVWVAPSQLETRGVSVKKQLLFMPISHQETKRCLSKTLYFFSTILASNAEMSCEKTLIFVALFQLEMQQCLRIKQPLFKHYLGRKCSDDLAKNSCFCGTIPVGKQRWVAKKTPTFGG